MAQLEPRFFEKAHFAQIFLQLSSRSEALCAIQTLILSRMASNKVTLSELL